MSIAAHMTASMNRSTPNNGWKVQYNGFTEYFASERKARAFAREVRGGDCKPVVKRA